MLKIKKYIGTETYMFPNGALATPEAVLTQFPAGLAFSHIVETDEGGEVMFAFENLSAARSRMGIDPSLSEADAILAIEAKRNEVPKQEPALEERIAAALEFQNLLQMEDAV